MGGEISPPFLFDTNATLQYMNTTTLVSIAVVIILLAGGWYLWAGGMPGGGGAAICPQDAMLCPDGSSVGRTGPNCEFAACPNEQAGDGSVVGMNLILGESSDAELGTYLSAYNGMTLYTTSKDTEGASNCAGECAVNWPPYTVPSINDINIPSTIDGTKVGTIVRGDGKIQITYGRMPLYFYITDREPGDTTGHGAGDVWEVARP